jgi:hypothetical protein
LNDRFAFLHPYQRYEKHGQVMVNADQPGLVKAAGRAHPGIFIQYHGLGLDSSDEKEHRVFILLS